MDRDRNSVPDTIKRADGSSRFAYVTLLMLNDNYLPGALTLAYGFSGIHPGLTM